MRIVLFDQDVAVETAHLMDREDADAAEGPCRNGKDFSFRHIRAELAVRCGLQAEECDVAGRDIAFEGSVGHFHRKCACHDDLVLHFTGTELA